MNSSETLSGVVIFQRTNAGSKSEALLPYLYRGKDEPLLPVYLKDDNPFENSGLTAYDGQSVTIVGAIERGKFVITEISK